MSELKKTQRKSVRTCKGIHLLVTNMTRSPGEKPLADKAMKRAEEAYERALASLRVLEQSHMGDMVAKSTGPFDGTDAEAGPIDGTETEANDEQSMSNMEAAAAKSTGPADTEASEDERSTMGDMAMTYTIGQKPSLITHSLCFIVNCRGPPWTTVVGRESP